MSWVVPCQARLDGARALTVYARSLLILLAASIGITASPLAVASQNATEASSPAARDVSTVVAELDSGSSDASDDDWFADIEAREDSSLADQSAKGLTNGELVLVIIFLILLFPVGVILLIVFLLT